MTEKKLLLLVVIMGVIIVLVGRYLSIKYPTHAEYYYELPEEIMAADSTDTMDAVLRNDTIFITFRNQHK